MNRIIHQPWTKLHIKRLRQPMGKKGTIHTFIFCWIDISRRKLLEAPSRATSTDSISLLTSIMKMLSHLSDKNHLFQELKPCGTTLGIWFQSFILSLAKYPAKKCVSSFLTQVSPYQSLGLPIIPFHNKNGVAALIHPVKNHIASETRAVLQTNGAISSPHLGFGIQIIPQKKSIRSPYQVGWHPNDQWKIDKLLSLVPTTRRVNSVLSFGFRYENGMRSWMFEQRRVWRQRIFFARFIYDS